MFVSVPMALSLKPNQDKSIVNKIWYCLYSCLNDNSYNDDFIYKSTELAFEERYVRKYKDLFPDRRITNSWYDKNRWTKMEFVKIFSLKETDNHKLEIYLKPTTKDYLWNPEHSVTLKNINIMILGN